MREYLMTLIGVSLFCGVVGMLSPEGNIKKYVRLLSALCVLSAIVGPLLSLGSEGVLSLEELVGEVEETEVDYEEIYNQALIMGGERQAADAIWSDLVQTFSIPGEALEVSVKFLAETEENTVMDVTLVLRDEAIFADPHRMIQYLEEQTACRCTVIYE